MLLGRKVTRIITENERAVAVEHIDALNKTSNEKEPERVFGRSIIANAAVPAVVNMLAEKETEIFEKQIASLSHLHFFQSMLRSNLVFVRSKANIIPTSFSIHRCDRQRIHRRNLEWLELC